MKADNKQPSASTLKTFKKTVITLVITKKINSLVNSGGDIS